MSTHTFTEHEDHPILKVFVPIFFEKWGYRPQAKILIADDAEADRMEVEIIVETPTGPAKFPFTAVGQSDMTDEEWSVTLRHEFRKWFKKYDGLRTKRKERK